MMARNTDVIPLSITHLLADAVENGDLEAVADIVAVYGFDENTNEVTPEPTPVPTCDNCQTVTPNLVFRYRHCTTGDGLELIETLCEACYNATGDEVTE